MAPTSGMPPLGGSPLGSRPPSENELEGARYQGRHVAEIANKIFRETGQLKGPNES